MKRLMVWFGPTSSSKSTGALGMAHRFAEQGRKVILTRPAISIRDYESIGNFKTKDGMGWTDPSFDLENPDQLVEISDREKPDVIWVDEPALFQEEQNDNLEPWLFRVITLLRQKYTFLVSGIGATSELEVFGRSLPLLLAVADEVIQCKGDCPWCDRMNVATRSVYLGDDPKITQDKVGGAELYQPACPECWNQIKNLTTSERRSKMKRSILLA